MCIGFGDIGIHETWAAGVVEMQRGQMHRLGEMQATENSECGSVLCVHPQLAQLKGEYF